MKKFLAILLAMMLVMVSVAAMATSGDTGDTGNNDTSTTTEGGNTEGGTTEGGETSSVTEYTKGTEYALKATDAQKIQINKNYTTTVNEGATIPSDELEFTVALYKLEGASTVTEATAPVPTVDKVTISEETIEDTEEGMTYPVTINLPSYNEVGVYTYKITEENSGVAGVTYHEAPWYLKITVIRNGDALQIGGIAIREETNKDSSESSTKIDSLENEFASGSLTVTKKVTGKLGDQTQIWNVTVTFESDKTVNNTISYTDDDVAKTIAPSAWTDGKATAEITLVHDETIQFDNIPEDVTYTIVETEADANGYSTTYEKDTGDIQGAKTIAAKITNDKDIIPDTGITLETLPYVLMMALAMMGLVALKLRKREEY